ncbi:unnamed protein product [Ostreobium quekettii]|uniref:Cytosolic endo-beta-N-acetylglucosaminidase TIM barrel domain-containing protein n=1 Tax=Ostreobium quekettii TaxID=121088 RepID=A0A8S1J961_9CHLO|nr:unnamed protein product [Ostreobium quekettii]
MVTIPPVGWINAGHRHGTKVLGTFCVEWSEGSQQCAEFLDGGKVQAALVKQLTSIAAHFGFDGWLLNFEVELDRKKHIPQLIAFVKELTRQMQEMCPLSLVIWYDAVTTYGRLRWQNAVTAKNQPFFDACNGILLNYSWRRGSLRTQASRRASRLQDEYVGVDVWGRSTRAYGEGYACVAGVAHAKASGRSCGLFAPAWVYEVGETRAWEKRNGAFWASVMSAWGCHAVVTSLPFYSSFNLGGGAAMHISGSVVSPHPWYNVSCQNIQPSSLRVLVGRDGASRWDNGLTQRHTCQFAYNGGSCLVLGGNLCGGQMAWCPLFDADIPVAAGKAV